MLGLVGKPKLGEKTLKKIYVGNLPFNATENDVKELFGQHGTVNSVALINDRETGRPRVAAPVGKLNRQPAG